MNKIFIGTVKNGKPRVKDLDSFYEHLKGFEGKEIELIVRNKKKTISDPQRRYYFGVIVKILADEIGCSKDEMHDTLKSQFLTEKVMVGEKEVIIVKSITDLNTTEMEEYNGTVKRWASEFLNCYIPDPNEVDF